MIDLEVDAGQLERVRLSGDFFLEPDETLGRITAALEGKAVDTTVRTYAQSTEAALDGTQMIGFDPRTVGFAVTRALGRSSAWSDHAFEILDTGPLHPPEQMAIDEVLAIQVAAGRRPPTLRVWE